MTAEFAYNWNGAKEMYVTVKAAGFNPTSEELLFPRIQFYPDADRVIPWTMYYDKKEFDTICRIAYTIFASTPEQNNQVNQE